MEKLNRRNFVKSSLGATGALAGAPLFWGNHQAWAGANDRIRVAVIGLRGQGRNHINFFSRIPGVEVAALCDVDENQFAPRLKMLSDLGKPKPGLYVDMRQLFDQKDIDAVSFATPNHWHALGSVWACQAGKHVYVEKPLSHNVYEGRKLVEAARKYNRMVQHGTNARSSLAVQSAVRFMRNGGIGEVYMARGLCFKWRDTIGTMPDEPVPKGVDYDLWLGPARKRPFSKNRFHYNWHWNWEYGNGDIGNQGVHQMDVARWGLGVTLPTQVQCSGAHFMFNDDQQTPNCQTAIFEFPAKPAAGDRKKILQFEVRHWMTNKEGAIDDGEVNTIGNIFYGNEGYLVVNGSRWRAFMGRESKEGAGARIGGNNWANFIDAIRASDRSLLNADVEQGHMSSVLCHLANTAYRLGRTLRFDPERERYVDDDEANNMLSRDYRSPFIVPETV